MADPDPIDIKRGRATTFLLTYTPEVNSGPKISKDFTSGFTASLVIRRKIGNSYNGPEVDTLTTANNRITFPNPVVDGAQTGPNIKLIWSSNDSAALPNEANRVFGDLKISTTGGSVEHSFRITIDILPEIK